MLTFEFSSTHVELLLKLNKTWLILAGIHVAKNICKLFWIHITMNHRLEHSFSRL